MKNFVRQYFPGLLKIFYLIKLSIQEKKLFPDKIQLSHSSNILFADPFEKRGMALLRNKGNGQPFIKRYWRTAIQLFNPEIVLDVGANYGEIFLDTKYPASTQKIIAVEANPFLHNYLCKSKEEHPKKKKIEIINGLAGEENIEAVSFYIDKTSSGRSTALKNNFVKKSHQVTVSSYRLDELIQKEKITLNTLLFKIDVEGFESFVLNGMTNLFNGKPNIIGCIEFNLVSLKKNDINVQDYLNFLNNHFLPLILKKDGSLIQVEQLSIENLKEHLTNDHVEGDLLLFTNKDHLEIFKHNFK